MSSITHSILNSKLVICVGAAKAGTSSLHTLLEQHPDIAVTSPKETDFFIQPDCIDIGASGYLKKYYPQEAIPKVYFESDPIYMYQDGAMENIADLFPDAYVIVMLRNPVRRAFSQYLYRMNYGRYSETFEQMCEKEFSRVSTGIEAKLEFGCLDRSMYAKQVRKILNLFPKERVHFIIFEEFIKNQQAVANALFDWIQLPSHPVNNVVENEGGKSKSMIFARLLFHKKYRNLRKSIGSFFPTRLKRSFYERLKKLNQKSYKEGEKPRLNVSTEAKLIKLFEQDIEELQQLTGLNLEQWKP
ncbi:sulfotransferase family protein [Methylophilus methylotrophus]|uniref:sulfotransferase family protein n=1 Tax=Methylophilus methylotrophus TaxID=17 RepID=UPI000F5AEDEC|nr:sulfotransferase [Methylophilus methylotrophus]